MPKILFRLPDWVHQHDSENMPTAALRPRPPARAPLQVLYPPQPESVSERKMHPRGQAEAPDETPNLPPHWHTMSGAELVKEINGVNARKGKLFAQRVVEMDEQREKERVRVRGLAARAAREAAQRAREWAAVAVMKAVQRAGEMAEIEDAQRAQMVGPKRRRLRSPWDEVLGVEEQRREEGSVVEESAATAEEKREEVTQQKVTEEEKDPGPPPPGALTVINGQWVDEQGLEDFLRSIGIPDVASGM